MKDSLKSVVVSIYSLIKPFLKPKNRFIYVAIGDSTVEGIGASDKQKNYASLVFESIKKENKNADFHNLGKSGATISDVIDTQLQTLLRTKPDLITVSVGANDIKKRTSVKFFDRDLAYLINSINENTSAKIILSGLPDVSQIPAVPFLLKIYAKYMIRKYNEALRNQAIKDNVTFVDISKSGMFVKNYPEMIAADGFHPSDLGYAFWAVAILSQAQEIFNKRSDNISK